MNKNHYRVIFNAARGQRMVVQENARSCAKAAGGEAAIAGGRICICQGAHAAERVGWAMLARPLIVAMAMAHGSLALAQIVADPSAPGAQRPTVLNAVNGVPQVNIQTPSAAGVSRNTYSQFDVQREGAILNNSRTNTQTQLGGWVQGNPWLATGSARIILNEVNSSNPSQLRGYVEVAGPRAEVIIANPAGVAIDGAGFINASRATITTGTPVLNGGSLEGYRVQRGSVSIDGQGLDASTNDYTGILARAVQVNAGVWANNLQVVTGVNDVGTARAADNAPVRAGVDAGAQQAPRYALDVAHLGGMYAGKITLVGTEAGVGVRNAGHIGASAGEVVVTANGQLVNSGQITAGGSESADVRLAVREGVSSSGLVYAQGSVDIESQTRTISQTDGTIAAQGNVTLRANGVQGQIASGPQAILAAGLAADGSALPQAGNVTLQAAQRVAAHGLIQSGAALQAQAGELDLRSGQLQASAVALAASDGDIELSEAQLNAAASLQLRAAQALRTASATISADHLKLDAATWDNSGGSVEQTGDARTEITVAGALVNRQGRIASNAADLQLQAQTLDNGQAQILHAGEGQLAIDVAQLQGQGGRILSNGALRLRAAAADLRDAATVAQHLQLQADQVDNRAGEIVHSGQGQAIVDVTRKLDNRAGLILSEGALRLAADQIDNSDTLASGGIFSQEAAEVQGNELRNAQGSVQSLGDLSIHAASSIDNTAGTIRSNAVTSVRTGSLANTQTLTVQRGIEGKTIHIDADHLDNRAGAILAGQDLRAEISTHLANQNGRMTAAHALTVADTAAGADRQLSIANTGGTLLAGNDLNLSARTLSGDGQVLSQRDMRIDLQDTYVHEQDGQMQANGTLDLASAADVQNKGSILAGEHLQIDARNIDNRAAGELAGGQTTTLTAAQTFTNRGLIDGVRTRLSAAQLDNLGTGRIYGDHLAIAAGHLHNGEETTASGQRQSAVIAARQRLDIGAQSIRNQEEALILSEGELAIGGTLTQDGLAQGQAQLLHNASATIESAGDMALAVADLRNTNEHFSTEIIPVGQARQLKYIQPNGSDTKILVDNLIWEGWSKAGQYRYNTTPNPETQVILGKTPLPYVDDVACTGEGDSRTCIPNYLPDDPVWQYFGITPPSLQMPQALTMEPPVAPDPAGQTSCEAGAGFNASACAAYQNALQQYEADRQAYDAAVREYSAALEQWAQEDEDSYGQLDEAIQRYNLQFSSDRIRAWTEFNVTRTERESAVASSAPAQIIAGGNLRITGQTVLNDKSRILAGQELQVVGTSMDNRQATGVHIIHEEGTSQYTYSKWRGGFKRHHERRWDASIAYTPADQVQTITLNVSEVKANTQVTGSGQGAAVRQQAPAVSVAIAAPAQAGGAYTGDTRAHVRTSVPSVSLPTASLYRQNPSPTAKYLIETDPRFANQRQWLSSDYLFDQLSYDPVSVQKRLGDGYYEQKLIREQIGQLTGMRYLQGYSDDEQQYQALMAQGAAFAREYQLIPGVALTAEQMAQLTSDIVWLVEQPVQAADGSWQNVLVPQVYVRANHAQVRGDAGLIAANNIELALSGELTNSATIAARERLQASAGNIHNNGGAMHAREVALQAREDLENIGGTIAAQSRLSALAGRDLRVASTTQSDSRQAAASHFSRTDIDRVGSLQISDPNGQGQLLMAAGRDIQLDAAHIGNAATGEQALSRIEAGRDIRLGTIETEVQEHNIRDARNQLNQSASQTVGSSIDTASHVQLAAGQDITATAANIASASGAITADAGRDIQLQAGRADSSYEQALHHKHRSTFSSKTVTTYEARQRSQAVGSTLSAEAIDLQAGRDLGITASDVVGTHEVTLRAGNDIAIAAGQHSQSQESFREVKKSGLFSGGGLGVTIGKQQQSHDMASTATEVAASTVGSVEGDVRMVAGRDYRQTGSDILTPQGDISITAQDIAITEAREQSQYAQESKFKQSGLSVSLSSPVVSAIESTAELARAAGKVTDTRMQALGIGMTALKAKGSYEAGKGVLDAVQSGDLSQAGGVGVSISLGSAKSESRTTQTSDSVKGSTLQAAGDIRLVAAGGQERSNILVRGSDVSAGENAILMAQNRIDLQAAQSTFEQRSTNSSSSASLGVAFTVGGQRSGVSINAAASKGRGNADGRDVVNTNSHIQAGETATLITGADLNIRGAQVSADTVQAQTGGNLNIESLQDTSSYASKQTSSGAGISVCVPPLCTGTPVSGNISHGKDKVTGDYAGVQEQSGILAGDGGFQISAGGTVDLSGAAIVSTAEPSKNLLVAQDFTYRDIENHASSKASSTGVALGFSYGRDQTSEQDRALNEKYRSEGLAQGQTYDKANPHQANAGKFGVGLSEGDVHSADKYAAAKVAGANLLANASASESRANTTRSIISHGTYQVGSESAAANLQHILKGTGSSHQRLEPIDHEALQEQAQGSHTIRQAALGHVAAITDEAYHSQFIAEHRMMTFVIGEDGEPVKDPERIAQILNAGRQEGIKQGKTGDELDSYVDAYYQKAMDQGVNIYELREVTDAERANLKPVTYIDPRTGQEKTQVAVMFNGIFNDIQASAKYAVQNYIARRSTEGGKVNTRIYENIYFVNNPPAASTLGENMVAVYQKMLEGLVGELGNSTEQAVELGEQYGQQGLFMGAHSRGSLTVANAVQDLAREQANIDKAIMSGTDMKMVGAAAHVAYTDNRFVRLQGQAGTPRHIETESSALDFVSTWIGFNPATGATNLNGKSWWSYTLDIFGGDSSSHNCYGLGNLQCQYDGYRSEQGEFIMHPGRTVHQLPPTLIDQSYWKNRLGASSAVDRK